MLNTNTRDRTDVSEQLAALGNTTVKLSCHWPKCCLHLLLNEAVSSSGYTVLKGITVRLEPWTSRVTFSSKQCCVVLIGA